MREDTALADHPRSYPQGQQVVWVDDTNTFQLQAAARELEALALHEQARHLAEVHALLAERHRRDGVQVTDAELDAQADHLALLERGDRFLQDMATRRSRAASCWCWPGSWTITALGCGGRPPPAWWTTARRAWRICAGGWRRSSAPNCAATPTWCAAKPSWVPSCTAWVW
jgi:hypothetical protein